MTRQELLKKNRMEMTKQEAVDEVRENGWNLEHIPERLIDFHFCMEAAQSVYPRLLHKESILCYVPRRLISEELCKTVLERDGRALRDVPEDMRNRELCLLAVRNFGSALIDVPMYLRDKEMCRVAVDEDGYAFLSVPDDLQTEELAYRAVKSNFRCLHFIPKKYLSERVCLLAMRWEHTHAREYIPEEMYEKLCYGY